MKERIMRNETGYLQLKKWTLRNKTGHSQMKKVDIGQKDWTFTDENSG